MMEQMIHNTLGFPILSMLICWPLAGAAFILFINRTNEKAIKTVSLFFSIASFLLSIFLFTHFDKSTHMMQFVERYAWIPNLNINYHLGLDGISVLFVLLSTLVTILCVLISWESVKIKTKEFFICLLPLYAPSPKTSA